MAGSPPFYAAYDCDSKIGYERDRITARENQPSHFTLPSCPLKGQVYNIFPLALVEHHRKSRQIRRAQSSQVSGAKRRLRVDQEPRALFFLFVFLDEQKK